MDLIKKYFNSLTNTQLEQFEAMLPFYEDWNSKINLVSRKDMEHFYEHHVLHSLAIAQYTSFKDFTEIMDAGTGGGFPGIPLAILFPKASFHLVDSIGKKIKVVHEAVTVLQLNNVTVEQTRIEQVDQTFDFIISRAVTNLSDFVGWTGNKFHKKSFNSVPNGIIYLKGGDLIEELKQIRGFKRHIINISDYFSDPYFETKKIIHLYR